MKTKSCFPIAVLVVGAMLAPSILGAAAPFPVKPHFDPFGAEAYTSASFYPNAENSLFWTVVDEKTGREEQRTIPCFGRAWDFIYPATGEEPRAKALDHILATLTALGYTPLFRDGETRIFRSERENGTVRTYVKVLCGWSDQFAFHVYENRFLRAGEGQTFTFDPGKGDSEERVLHCTFDGTRLYTARLDVLQGEGVDLTVKIATDDGPSVRDERSLRCEGKHYESYRLFDIPPYAGTHRILLRALSPDTKVTITVEDTGFAVPPLGRLTAKPAMLNLKNGLSSLPVVQSLGYIHGDFPPTGDHLPSGDAVYWLNGGYYKLTKDSLSTNLVPLIPNHETAVDWPLFYERMSVGDRKAAETKVVIYEAAKIDENTVKVDFTLSNLPRGVEPEKEDFSLFEAGNVRGDVLSLEKLHEPMNVVILVDSSYSMVHSMKTALERVEAFVSSLPADAAITVVDFDHKVKPIAASDRKDLIRKLRTIRASGSTALYDAVIKGLDLLAGKSRASLILFTDGKDANYDDTKRGSVATFDMMVSKIQANEVPIYPVAFGDGADTVTLNAIARMTKTTYYKGNDGKSLQAIFDDIRANISRAWTLTARRGKAPRAGSARVVNYMVDVSASMDLRATMDPTAEGCGNRFEQLKDMLARSIVALPRDTYVQLSSFASEIQTHQILTKDKARLLAGIGQLKAGGGTEIIKALQRGLELSRVVATNRRHFIFVTDATAGAFDFDEDEEKELKAALMAFKSSKIQTFWLGMVDEKRARKAIESLAAVSGGEAFLSNDVEKVREKILAVTEKIVKTRADEDMAGAITLELKLRDEKEGAISVAVGQHPVAFELLKEDGETDRVSDIDYVITKMDADAASYNFGNASKIYGNDIPVKEVRVRKIIPLLDDGRKPVRASNAAVDIELSRAILFSRIKDVSAPHGRQYLVLDGKLSNVLKPQPVVVLEDGSHHPSGWIGKSDARYATKEAIPHYKIPNLLNHLFIRVNDGNEVPFHPITWLLGEPLTEIDEYELSISPDRPREGVLAFEIPDRPISQLSLHYYDTAYGHMHVPIIGEMKTPERSLEELPQSSPAKLGEAFDLSPMGIEVRDEITGIPAGEGRSFEIVHLKLHSKVNALLNLQPRDRFFLRIHGPLGDWILRPHEITRRIPMGCMTDLSVAPGSRNDFALAFHVPEALRGSARSLLVELEGDDVVIPLMDGATAAAPASEARAPLARAKGDKIELVINRLHRIETIDGYAHEAILVDGTLVDEADHESTRISNLLVVANSPDPNLYGRANAEMGNRALNKGLGTFSSSTREIGDTANFSGCDPVTDSRILGYRPVVLDGARKRFLMVFATHVQKTDGKLHLVSPLFPDLKVEFALGDLAALPETEKWLLSKELRIPPHAEASTLERLLNVARQEKARTGRLRELASKPRVALDSPKELPQTVEPFATSLWATPRVRALSTVDGAVTALKRIEWVPSKRGCSAYAPESLFTQGWGSELDMIHVVHDILKTRNGTIRAGFYDLTEKGRVALANLAAGYPCTLSRVPYLSWDEGDGAKSLVFPFLRAAEELSEELDLANPSGSDPLADDDVSITLRLWWTRDRSTASMQLGAMGGALSGDLSDELESATIFEKYFPIHHVGAMPVDIWFAEGKDPDGKGRTSIFHTGPRGTELSAFTFERGCIPKKMEIVVHEGEKTLPSRWLHFEEGQKLSDFFFTLSIAAPDMPEAAMKAACDFAQARLKNIENMEALSLAQWTNRNAIFKFLGANTRSERELEKATGLRARHVETLRTLIATLERTRDGRLIRSLDLREVDPDLYGEDGRRGAFNLMAGLMATEAEAAAIRSDGKTSETVSEPSNVISLWKRTEGLKIVTLIPQNRDENLALFRRQEIPEGIVERLERSQRVWLFPSRPVDGRYGWLEIDPETYALDSVLDSGEHGAMTETIITMENIETTTRYFLGMLIGSNLAVGSVMSFALRNEDYDALKKNAQAMAKLLACYVKKMESAASKIKSMAENPMDEAKGAAKEAAKGEIPGGFDFSCDPDDGDGGEMPKKYSDYINFGKGVDHALAAYFASMP